MLDFIEVKGRARIRSCGYGVQNGPCRGRPRNLRRVEHRPAAKVALAQQFAFTDAELLEMSDRVMEFASAEYG
jgi:hypothetical protein